MPTGPRNDLDVTVWEIFLPLASSLHSHDNNLGRMTIRMTLSGPHDASRRSSFAIRATQFRDHIGVYGVGPKRFRGCRGRNRSSHQRVDAKALSKGVHYKGFGHTKKIFSGFWFQKNGYIIRVSTV